MKLKLDLHEIFNRGQDIDRALNGIIAEAVAKKATLVEIIPGKGSGQLKKRVLRFLGTHSELIYEGHDPLEVETKRLNEVGFDDVQVIMETERDRHVLHARRSR